MRWFWTTIVIVALLAVDRAYFDGQNAAVLMSLARQGARVINDWAEHFARLMRQSV
jgi:hypothetical protein